MTGCGRNDAADPGRPDAVAVSTAANAAARVDAVPYAGFTEAEVAAVLESDPDVVRPTPDGMFALVFATKGSPAGDARILGLHEGPCGLTVTAAVAAMPVSDPLLMADLVVEWDGQREIRRWSVPFEAQLLELEDDRLAFRAGYAETGPTFWTRPDGRLDPGADLPTRIESEAMLVDCPAVPAFEGSGYLQCVEVADRDGNRRRLAWEGRCT